MMRCTRGVNQYGINRTSEEDEPQGCDALYDSCLQELTSESYFLFFSVDSLLLVVMCAS